MKTKIICILVMTLLIATTMSVTGALNADKNNIENENTTKVISTSAPWTLQFSFDVTAASGASGNAGCEWDGTYFYTTRWATNLIHQYTSAGALVKQFSIAGVSGLRDLAYCPIDGLLYGGAAGGTIWGFDPIGETLGATLTGSFECRAIAYNEDLDVFFVSNWGDPVWIVDRTTGSVVGQFNLVTTTSTYGFAYDNICNGGGPYLWVFDQGLGATNPQYISQWDLTSGGYTGVQHDVNLDVGSGSGIAGGLFFATNYVPGYATLGGLYQDGDPPGTGDWIFCYEMCEANSPPTKPTITGPTSVDKGVNNCWTVVSEDAEGDLVYYVVDWGDGSVDSSDCNDPGDPVDMCHTYSETGNYIIKVKAVECPPHDKESDWAQLPIVVPRSKLAINTLVNWIQNHLNMFPLLQILLQRLGLY